MESSQQKCQSETKDSLTREEERQFFMLLKELLRNPNSLKEGEKVQSQFDGKTLRLAFGTKTCKVTVLNSSGRIEFEKSMATRDIYLQWREGSSEEVLSPENLQKVQNELRLVGVQSKATDACFSLAKTKHVQETQSIKANTTLKLICEQVAMIFVSGQGENVATVLHDSSLDKPLYSIDAAGWGVRTRRWIWRIFCAVELVFEELVDIGKTYLKPFLHHCFDLLTRFVSHAFNGLTETMEKCSLAY